MQFFYEFHVYRCDYILQYCMRQQTPLPLLRCRKQKIMRQMDNQHVGEHFVVPDFLMVTLTTKCIWNF